MNENAKEGLKKWRESGEVPERKTRQEKFAEKPTRKLAIDLACIHCIGGEKEPGMREMIKECTVKDCSLYIYRPYK
jgi:hypothetical protein